MKLFLLFILTLLVAKSLPAREHVSSETETHTEYTQDEVTGMVTKVEVVVTTDTYTESYNPVEKKAEIESKVLKILNYNEKYEQRKQKELEVLTQEIEKLDQQVLNVPAVNPEVEPEQPVEP